MGVLISKAIRPFKNWNVLNRAIKQTEKDKIKPRPAPKTTLAFESLESSTLNQKNTELEEAIHNFNITSSEMIEFERPKSKSHRPLPQKYVPQDQVYYGETSIEPVIIPDGKITATLLIEMLQKFRGDVSIEELADNYNLPQQSVYNILRFNRLFIPATPEVVKNTISSAITQEKYIGNLLVPEAYGKCTERE